MPWLPQARQSLVSVIATGSSAGGSSPVSSCAARRTQHIPDGATITIDGDRGTVTILETAEQSALADQPALV